MMLSPELTFLLGVAVFWIVLYALSRVIRLDKHGLDVKPFYFMYKSKALNKLLDRWAKKRRKLWLVLSNISIAFGVGLTAFSIYFLTNNLMNFFIPRGVAAPVFSSSSSINHTIVLDALLPCRCCRDHVDPRVSAWNHSSTRGDSSIVNRCLGCGCAFWSLCRA